MEHKRIIGTRGSKLALAQSEMIKAALLALHPFLEIELLIITTKGDQILDRALSRIGDKGLFVTEIETALLQGQIDLAVHSSKDLPSVTPDGLVLGAFPRRADPRDVLISRHGLGLAGPAARRAYRHVEFTAGLSTTCVSLRLRGDQSARQRRYPFAKSRDRGL